MLKKFAMSAAISALMLGGAAAQQQQQNMQPQQQQGMPAQSQTQAPATTGAGSAQFVTAQSGDQWLATNFTGTDVIGAKDEKIGDVTDILFDREGKVVAYVVSVGGFLGIGSKHVALAPSSFQVTQDNNEVKLRLSMTKEQLNQAQAFETKDDRRTTTGAGTPPRPATPPASTNR